MFNSKEKTKLYPKSRKCIFLDYANGVKGYRLWDPTTLKVIVSRDMIFAENELQRKKRNDNIVKKTTTVQIDEKSRDDSSKAD